MPGNEISPDRAILSEVFSGIQGEGIHVGRRQVFVRFVGCNLNCAFCDQPESRVAPEHCLVESAPGVRQFSPVPNPVDLDVLRGHVRRLAAGSRHHSVSLTGGEPLLRAGFLGRLVPRLREAGLRAYLDTNGTLPDAMAALARAVDIVCMDVKLASASGEAPWYEVNREFVRAAAECELFVKVVVCAATTEEEIAQAISRTGLDEARVPLVLQPVTPVHRGPMPPAPSLMLSLQACAAGALDDVRVIPQTHKIMGQR